MTAQQYSGAVAQQALTFAGALVSALQHCGYEVDHAQSDVLWRRGDLDKYSRVLVGIAPVLGVTSNGAYGTLNLISELQETDKLMYFVDAPQPGKVDASLRAVARDEAQLTKSFYSRRRGYSTVMSDSGVRSRVFAGVAALSNDQWPTTLWPTLPWHAASDAIRGVPQAALSKFVGVNLDARYVTADTPSLESTRRRNVWGVDMPTSRWVTGIKPTLLLPLERIKQHRRWSDATITGALREVSCALLTIHDDKRPWWSPYFTHALNSCTPVATDWKYSSVVGPAWSQLAGAIEQMSVIDKFELSVAQRREYLDKVPAFKDTLTVLRQAVEAR